MKILSHLFRSLCIESWTSLSLPKPSSEEGTGRDQADLVLPCAEITPKRHDSCSIAFDDEIEFKVSPGLYVLPDQRRGCRVLP